MQGHIGIDEDGEISYGYDGRMSEAQPGNTQPDAFRFVEPMTAQQKLQLADEMLARWMRYRADVMREG